MKRAPLKKALFGLSVVPVVLALLVADGRVSADDKAEGKKEVKKKERAKTRGRLPNYFAAVVSQSQREQVYAIQARYAKQIDDLQRQIDELETARDKEVDGVLTAEQLEKVNAKREEAKARRAARSKKSTASKKKPDDKEG